MGSIICPCCNAKAGRGEVSTVDGVCHCLVCGFHSTLARFESNLTLQPGEWDGVELAEEN